MTALNSITEAELHQFIADQRDTWPRDAHDMPSELLAERLLKLSMLPKLQAPVPVREIEILGDFIALQRDAFARRSTDQDSWDLARAIVEHFLGEIEA